LKHSPPPCNPDAGASVTPNLLFHGDNKEVLAYLLTNGYRGKVNLIYIDPPFDSKADYVRKVELRGMREAITIEGESYTPIEQVQYSDIWANDTYLQFMYERLLLLKELLAVGGSIWLHCDWHKSHLLRCLMDEVFSPEGLRNEVIWQRTDPHNDAKSRIGWVHDTLLWYGKGEKTTYNWEAVVEPLSEAALKEYSLMKLKNGDVVDYKPELDGKGRRFKLDDCTYKGNDSSRRFDWRGAKPSDKRVWPYDKEGMDAALERGEFYLRDKTKGAASCRVSFLDEREGQVLQTIWTGCGRMKGGVDYPTEKPRALLARIIQGFSNPDDIVLDCFVGSGTTAIAAQALGRRWIACDINKGAIQTTSKRLQKILNDQLKESRQGKLDLGETEDGKKIKPVLSFNHYRINDYDLQIQHNEALELALEHVGVTRTRTDSFFEGQLGKKLVKVVPLVHPCTLLDVQLVETELKKRPEEDRNVVIIALGKDANVDAYLAERNKRKPVNKIELIELRTDPKYGDFFTHQPAWAHVAFQRKDDSLRIEITDFSSPTILQRLSMDETIFRERVTDFRAMIDVVLIDTDYNGEVFNICHSDVPEKKTDFVKAGYDLSLKSGKRTVAIKIIDMLGEEILITQQV
jgi:adenine-specific DNA-methyltransferase